LANHFTKRAEGWKTFIFNISSKGKVWMLQQKLLRQRREHTHINKHLNIEVKDSLH